MNKALAVMYLFPGKLPLIDFNVRNDGDERGQYIDMWNIDAPQPTEAELEAAYVAWEAEHANDPPPETPGQKIARLEAEKAVLQAQVTQLNGDFAGFLDFYFTQNPDQA